MQTINPKIRSKCCKDCPMIKHELNIKGIDSVTQVVSKKNPDCDWFVNSAEYNYCFWNMLGDINGYQMSEKEICQLLCITPKEMQESLDSAINKIRGNLDSPEMALFIEALQEKSNLNTETHNIPENIKMFVYSNELGSGKTEDIEEDANKPKRGRPKKGFGQPIHQAGKKVDIYFSGKKREKTNPKK